MTTTTATTAFVYWDLLKRERILRGRAAVVEAAAVRPAGLYTYTCRSQIKAIATQWPEGRERAVEWRW